MQAQREAAPISSPTKPVQSKGKSGAAGAGGTAAELRVLSKEYIRERMQELVPLVQECYEAELASQPDLHGDLKLRFVIDGEPGVGGVVSESAIIAGSLAEIPELSRCVRETSYTLKFAPPEAGGSVTVVYPFIFESE
jgi:hypothetical protein